VSPSNVPSASAANLARRLFFFVAMEGIKTRPIHRAAIYSSFFELVKRQGRDLRPFNNQGLRRSSAMVAQGDIIRV
jgi:hypothetical protein